MTNLALYDSSLLDMDNLNRYAKRVAQSTHAPLDSPITYTEFETIYKTHTTRGFLGLGKKDVRSPETITKEIEAVGPHWKLSTRDWHKQEISKSNGGGTEEEETHEDIYVVLLPTGRFLVVIRSTTEFSRYGEPRTASYYRTDSKASTRQLSASDVLDFDFEARYKERTSHYNGAKITVWGDRERGRLLYHAKGVGLSLALTNLLNRGRV